jgi:two-component system response regulator YesN
LKKFPIQSARSRSILAKFFISYIAMLLIAMSVGIAAYLEAGHAVELETNRYNNAMLRQVSGVIDTQLKGLEQLAVRVTLNKSLYDATYSGNALTCGNQNNMSTLLDIIFEYKNQGQFIYDMYVYLKKYDLILGPNGCWSPQFYFEHFYKYKDMDYRQWYASLEAMGNSAGYVPLHTVNLGNWKSNMITYVYPLKQSSGGYTGSVVLLIDEKYIYQLLEDIEIVNNGTLYVVDGKNRLIASTETNYDIPISLKIPETTFANNISGKSGQVNTRLDGKDVVISYTSSNVNDWKYISIIPSYIFMKKVENIRNLTIIVSSLFLAAGILLACFLAFKNYHPIRELLHTLTNSTDISGKFKIKNEYDLIKQMVLSTMDESQKIKGLLEKQRSALRFSFLSRLLHGNVSKDENIIGSLEYFNIEILSDQFAVALLHIDKGGSVLKNNSVQEWTLIQLITTNVVEEIGNKIGKVHVIEKSRQQFALLINPKEDLGESAEGQLLALIEEMKGFLESEFRFVLTIGIGRPYIGMERINLSLQEAYTAYDYKLTKGIGSIICAWDIQEERGSYYYPLDTEVKLINLIKAGESCHVENAINDIFEENFTRRNLPFKLVQCLFFDIMSTAVKILNELKVDYEEIFGADFDPLSRLLACQTVNDMRETTMNIFQRICSHIVHNRKSRNTELKEKIIAYIEENYGDTSLGVAPIAEKLGINPSYLSYFFKEQTNRNLSDFIKEVRLRKAEQLLKSSNLKISEIAELVGYGTANTFIRVFKKDRGITPGECRDKTSF